MNPYAVELGYNTWTLVAENVTSGVIEIVDYEPDNYFKDYRVHADPAPTDPNPTIRGCQDRILEIGSVSGIDVYMKFTGSRKEPVQVVVNL